MALNKVMLIGNVGKEPETRYIERDGQDRTKVATFTLATSERYKDRNGEPRENKEWHNIVAWRNSADIVEKYVHKGTQLYIEGKLRTRSYTDNTGTTKYTTEIIVDSLQMLGRRSDNEGGYQPQQPAQQWQSQQPASRPAPASYPATPSPAIDIDTNAGDDDLPF